MADRRAVARGPLPLSPKATLTWLAFADDTLTPVAMDSANVLRGWVPSFGGSWTRVFHANDDCPGMGVWPAGISAGELHFVECEPGECPQVRPRTPAPPARSDENPALCHDRPRPPLLQPCTLLTTVAKPLSGARLQAPEAPLEEHEAPLMALRARLACLEHAATTALPAPASLDAATAAARTATDKTLLRLFHAAVRADKVDRALQLVSLCASPPHVHTALCRIPCTLERVCTRSRTALCRYVAGTVPCCSCSVVGSRVCV